VVHAASLTVERYHPWWGGVVELSPGYFKWRDTDAAKPPTTGVMRISYLAGGKDNAVKLTLASAVGDSKGSGTCAIEQPLEGSTATDLLYLQAASAATFKTISIKITSYPCKVLLCASADSSGSCAKALGVWSPQ
jgi:hypothetical protein